jgi:hypothetical protein
MACRHIVCPIDDLLIAALLQHKSYKREGTIKNLGNGTIPLYIGAMQTI